MEANSTDMNVGLEKLKKLREFMGERNYDAYIVPHSDTHDVIKK
jgi:hypothetical protein